MQLWSGDDSLASEDRNVFNSSPNLTLILEPQSFKIDFMMLRDTLDTWLKIPEAQIKKGQAN